MPFYLTKIQLVVYYQCRILIGWATTRLYVIYSPLVVKSPGFETQNNGGWIVLYQLKLFCLDIFDQLVFLINSRCATHSHTLQAKSSPTADEDQQ